MNSDPKLSSDLKHGDYLWIAESAYYKALARDFVPGHDQEDWLEAKIDYENIVLPKRQKNGLVCLVSDNFL